MSNYLFDQKKTKRELKSFFRKHKTSLSSFGSAVNQTFEAYVFAKVIKWFQEKGYTVEIKNPTINGEKIFRLKFSTRGAPKKYSYALLTLEEKKLQLRHQLRVSTFSHRVGQKYNANICCDIAILNDHDLSDLSTDDAIPNKWLLSFGEVKHMSAFAELVASFIGLVHELSPKRLKKIRGKNHQGTDLPPFLYASGYMNPTAKGISQTIEKRKYDIDVYSYENPM